MRIRWSSVANLALLGVNLTLLLVQLGGLSSDTGQVSPPARQGAPACMPQTEASTSKPNRPQFPWQPKIFTPWNKDWDGAEAAFQADQKLGRRRHPRRLFMVRHGQYYGSGPKQGHLSSVGEKQAHLVGKYLQDLGVHFDVMISSASVRARETAAIIQQYLSLPINHTELLREGWPTVPEPLPNSWDPWHKQFYVDGIRIDNAFKTFIHRAESSQTASSNELIVAHGNIIGNFILRSLQLAPERWLNLAVYQGTVSIFDISPEGLVTVRVVGDIGHLPPNLWTG